MKLSIKVRKIIISYGDHGGHGVVPHCHITKLSHCHIYFARRLRRPRRGIPHCHIVTLSHCLNYFARRIHEGQVLTHCHIITLSHCQIATLSHYHIITLSHCHIGMLGLTSTLLGNVLGCIVNRLTTMSPMSSGWIFQLSFSPGTWSLK